MGISKLCTVLLSVIKSRGPVDLAKMGKHKLAPQQSRTGRRVELRHLLLPHGGVPYTGHVILVLMEHLISGLHQHLLLTTPPQKTWTLEAIMSRVSNTLCLNPEAKASKSKMSSWQKLVATFCCCCFVF
jgi:hypothetical protein